MLRSILQHTGINPDRVLLSWVSSSEASRFAQVVQEFTEWVRALGPLETKGKQSARGKTQEVHL
jgi:F420-non-reducing hydrogenase iron-sulfur subunit